MEGDRWGRGLELGCDWDAVYPGEGVGGIWIGGDVVCLLFGVGSDKREEGGLGMGLCGGFCMLVSRTLGYTI